MRYREAGTAFVVRQMSVVHHRRLTYGHDYRGQTWVRRLRRGTLSTRELVLLDGEGDEVVRSSQEWVHVDKSQKPCRGRDELVNAFTPLEEGQSVVMPEFEAKDLGAEHVFTFNVWHTWMDPLGHVNHPAYLDFCDEALARALRAAGADPEIAPLAESVTFYSSLLADEDARVRTRCIGEGADGALVFDHIVERNDGERCAQARTFRRGAGLECAFV